MIYYVTFWAADKNYGKSINEAIERLNPSENDFVCLRDGDSCFLTPDWGNQLETIVANADGYDLIGCSTNRLREPHQLVNGMFSPSTTLECHYATALDQQEIHGTHVIPFHHDIAGMFMLFRYSAWKTNKFKENTAIFDRLFTRGITKGRVGIAPGLYVLHMYRLWSNNPKNDSKHLM